MLLILTKVNKTIKDLSLQCIEACELKETKQEHNFVHLPHIIHCKKNISDSTLYYMAVSTRLEWRVCKHVMLYT